MKKVTIYKKTLYALVMGVVAGFGLIACEEYPDAFKPTDGIPKVLYVRMPDADQADKSIDGSFLGSTVCLVGNNLRSIHELYFNEHKAVLNTSFMTDHTLIVAIPKAIPEFITNTIYMVTANKDTVTFPFIAMTPPPVITAMSCEYALEGTVAELYGDFFVDRDGPMSIDIAGVEVNQSTIRVINSNTVEFEVPVGAPRGYITAETTNGKGRSSFLYKDDRGMILDWDVLTATGGWRSGITSNVDGVAGNYVIFNGNLDGNVWENEDDVSFNLWGTKAGRPQGDLFDAAAGLENWIMKFEVKVTEWTTDALQIIFTPWATMDDNSYVGDEGLGRALWMPWTATGSYDTGGKWITVSFPLTDFRYSNAGKPADPPKPGGYGGLTMFVAYGGDAAAHAGRVEMRIDNIRVIPAR
jgi:hypothetical protein